MKFNRMTLFVLIGLTELFSACSKQASPSVATTAVTPAPTEDKQSPITPDPEKDQKESVTCEKSLKEKMIRGEFRFSEKQGLHTYVNQANKSVSALKDKTFLLKKDEMVREIGVSNCQKNSDIVTCFVSTLTKTNEEKGEYLLKLNYTSSSSDKFVGLEEKLSVDKGCQLTPVDSTLTLVDVLENSKKKVIKGEASNSLSKKEEFEKFRFQQFEATENSYLKIADSIELKKKLVPLLFVDKFEDLESAPLNYSIYDHRTLGLLDYNMGSETTEKLYTYLKKIPYTDEKFDIRKFKISFLNKTISFGYHAVNKMKTKFIKYLDGEFQIESIDDIISSAQLSSVEDIYKIRVNTVDQSNSSSFATVIFRKRMDSFYLDLTNYWDFLSVEYDKGGTILYLTDKYIETVYDETLPSDLASTSLIQINHPEIQRVKQQILNSDLIKQDMKERFSEKPSRKLLLVLIQKYMSENFELEPISFENMPEFSSVEEILESKRGNSQDLSLVFLALARSLGIPSHLEVGYELKQPYALPTVWVEAQVRELDSAGYWMGIDFKSDGGLMLKNIKNVIPVAKGFLIEQGKRTLKQTLDTYKSGGEITILKPNQ